MYMYSGTSESQQPFGPTEWSDLRGGLICETRDLSHLLRNESLIRLVLVSLKRDSGFASCHANFQGNYEYGRYLGVRVFTHTHAWIMENVYLAKNVYLTDLERSTSEDASIH